MLYASAIKLKALPKHAKTMKRTLRSLLIPVLTSMLLANAQAQVVTYNYTGTKTSGDAFFGATVTIAVTLDLSAAPSSPSNAPDERSEWRREPNITPNYVPNIKINAVTTNFNAGTDSTTLENSTVLQQSIGAPGLPLAWNLSWLGFNQLDTSDVKQIAINLSIPAGNSPNLNKIADPIQGLSGASLSLFDATHQAYYTITGPAVTNIIIDGKDTGIKDFSYKGQAVSAILASYASSAKNHDDYVDKVEELAEKLVKAKLLTKAQAKTLTQAAEKSSIGKKPKKDKEDKDDKGKGGKDKDDD